MFRSNTWAHHRRFDGFLKMSTAEILNYNLEPQQLSGRTVNVNLNVRRRDFLSPVSFEDTSGWSSCGISERGSFSVAAGWNYTEFCHPNQNCELAWGDALQLWCVLGFVLRKKIAAPRNMYCTTSFSERGVRSEMADILVAGKSSGRDKIQSFRKPYL